MGEYSGSYQREERVYHNKGYGIADRRSNIGLGDHLVVEKLLSLPGIPRSGRLLELGSGDGNGTVHLAKWNYDIVGVEVSSTAVEMACRRLKDTNTRNAQVLCIDATSLDGLDDALFDLAIDSGCLHCIVDLDDRCDVLCSVSRVLKPGGSFVGVTQAQPFVKSVDSETVKQQGEILFTKLEGTTPDWGPGRIIRLLDDLLGEFEHAGFEMVWHDHQLFNKEWFC